jgi:hypothetical protein
LAGSNGFSSGIAGETSEKLLFVLTPTLCCSKNISLLSNHLDIDPDVLAVIVKTAGIYRSIQEEAVRG